MFRSGFSCVLFPLLVWLLRKLVLGKKKKILGHRMGPEVPWPNGARGARGARWGGSGPRKKNPFTIGPGLGLGSRPAGRARVWKNPARTRLVAIPTCPIKTLLVVVERPMSCEITIQVSFPHKCGQFSWYNALNMEVVTFLDISSSCCLHDSVVFLEALLSSVGNYLKYSQGVFAPRDP